MITARLVFLGWWIRDDEFRWVLRVTVDLQSTLYRLLRIRAGTKKAWESVLLLALTFRGLRIAHLRRTSKYAEASRVICVNSPTSGIHMRVVGGIYISTGHPLFAASLTKISESCEVSERQERASSKRFLLCFLHLFSLNPGPGFCVSVCIRKVSYIFLYCNKGEKIFRKDFLREILREWEIVRNFAALKERSAALGHHDSLMV